MVSSIQFNGEDSIDWIPMHPYHDADADADADADLRVQSNPMQSDGQDAAATTKAKQEGSSFSIVLFFGISSSSWSSSS